MTKPPKVSPAGLWDLLRPGETVFVGGSAGEPRPVLDAWLSGNAPDKAVTFITSCVPGINRPPLERLGPSTRVVGLFPVFNSETGRTIQGADILPLSYFGFARAIRAGLRIDTAIIMVAPPDRDGNCSLGPLVEFLPTIIGRGARIFAVINPRLPPIIGAPTIALQSCAAYCEVDAPLIELRPEVGDELSSLIAGRVADLVPDGATLQTGIGKLPAQVLARLTGRRGLGLHSGVITEDALPLFASGAVASGTIATCCALLGTASFYDWLRHTRQIRICGAEITHDPAYLAQVDSLIAINSAIEVDLLGQVNLERAGGRLLSAVGGAPDFAEAASRSSTGRSIIAMASATARGRTKIVPPFASGVPVGIARQFVDFVVTEHGTADLRGKTQSQRAEALCAIALPEARNSLFTAWESWSRGEAA
ncbi:acetyl-CoA hydrolase/transferase family protein [Sphingobium sp. TomTYG45]